MTAPKMKLYLAGGAGLNIGNTFVKYLGQQAAGFAEIDMVFIDTSASNITSNIPKDKIYLVDGLDGSGKLRRSNYDVLAECSKEILHMHKPADVNVIIHSTAGGSGSTISPLLVSELLARGETVIVIMIGSTSSKIETVNTANTLKSYEAISQKRGVPVIAVYRENSIDKPRSVVDKELQTMIIILAAMFSGSNRELDGSDLRNFLNYTRVTSYGPKLTLLDLFSKDIVLGKGQSVISLATLVDENVSSEAPLPTEYQAVGYLPDACKEAITINLPIHAATITGYYNGVIDALDAKIAGYGAARDAVIEKSIIKSTEGANEAGIFL